MQNDKLKIEGTVIDTLPDTKFRVKLSDGREIFAYLSGKMRMNYIKVMMGDKVTVELSPDGNKGRIVYRKYTRINTRMSANDANSIIFIRIIRMPFAYWRRFRKDES